MIVDKLANWRKYYEHLGGLDKAFKFLEEKAYMNQPLGRQDVEGDRVYVLNQKYVTTPAESKEGFEAHRKYIDIQYVVIGEEVIEWSPIEGLEVTSEYNDEKDYSLYKRTEKSTLVKMYPGYFIVLFPDDGHMACCQLDDPCDVRKVVLKVRVGSTN
jgi:biofilm protein TabA